MTIIDTHAHLDHLPDADAALARAAEAGVTDIVAMGVDLTAIKKTLDLKQRMSRPKIHAAFGIHPGNINADEIDATLTFMRDHIKDAVAIGETGLDYWYKWVRKNEDEKKKQRDIFQKQIDLAKEFQLPIVIHSRGAWRDCLDMVKSAGIRKANFHWYSGPIDVLKDILSAGYFVSCSPSLAYSPQSREAITNAPIERTLIETDCPVFYKDGPDTESGFQAEPRDVARTLKAYAALKGVDEDQAAGIFNHNAREFFGM